MTKEQKKRQFCATCRNNYYNQPGNSPAGECWSLDESKVVKRVMVGVWEDPPYYRSPVSTLSCHHFEVRDTWIKPTDSRVRKPGSQPPDVTPGSEE